MHILWVNEVARLSGGCERYIYETVSLLKQQGVRSTLLYSVESDPERRFVELFEGAYPMVSLRQQVAQLAPDVIYVHRLASTDALMELSACGVPIARFFHDHRLFCPREHKYTVIGRHTCTRTIGPGCYTCLGVINRSERPPGIKLITVGSLKAEHRVNMRCDAFVVGSAYMAGHIAAHGFDPRRTHVLPLYASPPVPTPTIEREHDLILFAGLLSTGKGVDTLLDALKRMHAAARLVILGSGKFEAAYRAQCAQLGLKERVQFGGRVSPEELAQYYQRAACVAIPSRTPETFGLMGVEAMSYGAPVVATGVGGMTEWLRDGENGLMTPPNDSAALAAALDRLILDPELAARMGENGKRLYHERFRPEAHIAGLLQVFREMMNARRKPDG